MSGYGGGGFGLWTDSILQIQNRDLALIYTFIINIYLITTKKFRLPNLKWIFYYKTLIIFLTLCLFFSLVYYKFSIYQIIQGGRNYLLIASLPILIHITPKEFYKIFKIIIAIITLTSILYILQVVFNRPIMPYTGKGAIDSSVGLIRLYNYPFEIAFFLTLSFIVPRYFKGNILFYRVLFFIALICTFGRTQIITGILMILLALFLQGRLSKLTKYSILIIIMCIPFIGVISKRFEQGNTKNDLQQILNGEFGENYQSSADATFTYRFAWMYERASYLIKRPLSEQIFGLGMIADSQNEVHKMYKFKIGLYNKDLNRIVQLSTPDISYGNLFVNLGFIGAFFYLLFAIKLTSFFYKERNKDPLFIVCTAYMIMLFIKAFSSNSLSQPQFFSFMFLFLPIYFLRIKTIKKHENNSY